MDRPPKASVCMITYNHERLIAQALDSALGQRTNFEYEIVIGEDCSTDGTRAIVEDYARKHPTRIRPLWADKNRGITPNFAATLQACRGQYIALLEGDDFWNSPDKLQRQVDFLDRNPESVLCFHDVWTLRDGEAPVLTKTAIGRRRTLRTIDLLNIGNFIPTCSAVFRRPPTWEFPDWFFTLRIGDFPLHIMTSSRGTLSYLPVAMATYRLHPGGTFSAVQGDKRLQEVLRMYDFLNQHLHYRHDSLIRSLQDHWRAVESFRVGDIRQGRIFAARCLRNSPLSRRSLAAAMMLASPRLYRLLQRYRDSLP